MSVTQEDRDAAANYAANGSWGDGREHWLKNADDSHPLIQALAAHREAATRALLAERDALRDRLAEAERVIADLARCRRLMERDPHEAWQYVLLGRTWHAACAYLAKHGGKHDAG